MHFVFSRKMLNGHPGRITLGVRRMIVRGVNHNLIVTSTTDGVHAAGSYHFTKPLGKAVDMGHRRPGTPFARHDLVAYQKFLLKRFGAPAFLELFGPDNTHNVKNGRRVTLDEGSALENMHDNHVHVVPARVLPLPRPTRKIIARRRRRRAIKRAVAHNPLGQAIVTAAVRHNISVPLAFGLIEQESGFRNVVGHDRDREGNLIFPAKLGTVLVSEPLYRLYRHRDGLPQGFGPAQLTSKSIQDLADKRGGTWKPEANIDVAMEILAGHIRALGLRKGIGAYNGGRGNPQLAYADEVLARARKFEKLFKF